MNRLALCALQESYSVKFGCSAERIGVTGGHDRYIKSTNTKKHLVQVSFVLREDDYLYFRAFYQNWQLNPLPFLMKLIIEDDEYKDYITQFVKNSCQFDELEGEVFKVSAQLSVFISPVIALTSKPYPYYLLESIATNFDFADSPIQKIVMNETNALESVATAFAVESVVMRTLTNETNLAEYMSTVFAIESVQITKQGSYLSTATQFEKVSTVFDIENVQITKTVNYLSTTQDVEKIQTAFAIESAQITN